MNWDRVVAVLNSPAVDAWTDLLTIVLWFVLWVRLNRVEKRFEQSVVITASILYRWQERVFRETGTTLR